VSERIKLAPASCSTSAGIMAMARRARTVTVTDPFANKLTFSESND
jgi:hypothetical protein